jgi:two-component system, OmpR family, alkaline phosphatase synthesis response regulator PhoP
MAMDKILVVDDDQSIVMLLQHILSRAGYDVCVARDGREALAVARQENPNLIILDIMMPELDGISVSGILFQDPLLKRIPVIILTAKGSARNLLELVPNVRIYMDKPFDPPDLLKNIRRFLPGASSEPPQS